MRTMLRTATHPRILALLACCLLAEPARAQSVQFDLGLSAWRMGISGTASVGADGAEGTVLDVDDDLGFDDRDDVAGIGLVIGRQHQLELSYLSFDASAAAEVDRRVRFGDAIYEAGTRVATSIDATLLRAAYRYAAGSDAFQRGFLLGLQTADIDLDASARGAGRGEGSVRATLPVIGLFAVVWPVPFIGLEASLVGGSWNWSDTSVSFVDAQAMARLNLFPFFLAGGYRYVSIESDDTGLPMDADLDFEGPQVAAGLQF